MSCLVFFLSRQAWFSLFTKRGLETYVLHDESDAREIAGEPNACPRELTLKEDDALQRGLKVTHEGKSEKDRWKITPR